MRAWMGMAAAVAALAVAGCGSDEDRGGSGRPLGDRVVPPEVASVDGPAPAGSETVVNVPASRDVGGPGDDGGGSGGDECLPGTGGTGGSDDGGGTGGSGGTDDGGATEGETRCELGNQRNVVIVYGEDYHQVDFDIDAAFEETPTDELHPSCGEGRFELVYAVQVDVPSTIELTLEGDDASFSVRTDCRDAASEVACSDAGATDTLRLNIERGRTYVVVQGSGSFRLSGTAAVREDDACGDGWIDYEIGERCDDGNDVAGDGCTACQLDCGGDCSPPPAAEGEECRPIDMNIQCQTGLWCISDTCTQPSYDELCQNNPVRVLNEELADNGVQFYLEDNFAWQGELQPFDLGLMIFRLDVPVRANVHIGSFYDSGIARIELMDACRGGNVIDSDGAFSGNSAPGIDLDALDVPAGTSLYIWAEGRGPFSLDGAIAPLE